MPRFHRSLQTPDKTSARYDRRQIFSSSLQSLHCWSTAHLKYSTSIQSSNKCLLAASRQTNLISWQLAVLPRAHCQVLYLGGYNIASSFFFVLLMGSPQIPKINSWSLKTTPFTDSPSRFSLEDDTRKKRKYSIAIAVSYSVPSNHFVTFAMLCQYIRYDRHDHHQSHVWTSFLPLF